MSKVTSRFLLGSSECTCQVDPARTRKHRFGLSAWYADLMRILQGKVVRPVLHKEVATNTYCTCCTCSQFSRQLLKAGWLIHNWNFVRLCCKLSTSVNYYSTTALRGCALAPSFLWIVRQLAFSQFRPSIVEGCYWLSKASGPVQQGMASSTSVYR